MGEKKKERKKIIKNEEMVKIKGLGQIILLNCLNFSL